MNLMAILGIVLALSMLGNAALGRAYMKVRDRAVAADSARLQAATAAETCSKSVDQLQAVAAERDREAVRARTKAEDAARGHQTRAQQILATPASTPGDACKSAGDRFDAWLQGRAKP